MGISIDKFLNRICNYSILIYTVSIETKSPKQHLPTRACVDMQIVTKIRRYSDHLRTVPIIVIITYFYMSPAINIICKKIKFCLKLWFPSPLVSSTHLCRTRRAQKELFWLFNKIILCEKVWEKVVSLREPSPVERINITEEWGSIRLRKISCANKG